MVETLLRNIPMCFMFLWVWFHSLAEREQDPILCRTEAEGERKRGTTERGGSRDNSGSPLVTSFLK